MRAILVSLSAFVLVGAAAAAYAWPNYRSALPNFDGLAELFPRGAPSAPMPDPVVTAALKDIQSAQQQNAIALQENGAALQQNAAMLQQGAATLESVRQGFLNSADGYKKSIRSTRLADCAGGFAAKCGDASDDLIHSTVTRPRPGGIAQKGCSTA
jgi:hypothetical protein